MTPELQPYFTDGLEDEVRALVGFDIERAIALGGAWLEKNEYVVNGDVRRREELVAEMGSALLCAEAGIACATLENQAAYVAGWLKVLEEDSRAVIFAAAQAQRAVDRILGREPERA